MEDWANSQVSSYYLLAYLLLRNVDTPEFYHHNEDEEKIEELLEHADFWKFIDSTDLARFKYAVCKAMVMLKMDKKLKDKFKERAESVLKKLAFESDGSEDIEAFFTAFYPVQGRLIIKP